MLSNGRENTSKSSHFMLLSTILSSSRPHQFQSSQPCPSILCTHGCTSLPLQSPPCLTSPIQTQTHPTRSHIFSAINQSSPPQIIVPIHHHTQAVTISSNKPQTTAAFKPPSSPPTPSLSRVLSILEMRKKATEEKRKSTRVKTQMAECKDTRRKGRKLRNYPWVQKERISQPRVKSVNACLGAKRNSMGVRRKRRKIEEKNRNWAWAQLIWTPKPQYFNCYSHPFQAQLPKPNPNWAPDESKAQLNSGTRHIQITDTQLSLPPVPARRCSVSEHRVESSTRTWRQCLFS